MPSKELILDPYGGALKIAKRIISAASKVAGSGVAEDENVDEFAEHLTKISPADLGKYLAINGINLNDIFPDSENISPLESLAGGVSSGGQFASGELLDITFSKMDALNAICTKS